MKLVILSALLAALFASANSHAGWGKFGFWVRRKFQNVNCRIKHGKSVVDERGHVTRCVRNCEPGYEEKYSWKYGHYCKKLPDGCAERSCRRCLPGYLELKPSYFRSRCVRKCPGTFEEKNGKCLELPRGCENFNCSRCVDGYFYYPLPTYFGTKCRTRCPIGYEKNRKKNTCDRKTIKEGCLDYFCYRCAKGYYKMNDRSYRNKCVAKCPNGYGPVKGSCRRIPSGCKYANCTECVDGYFYYSRSVYFQSCRSSCPTGYHEDTEKNACVPCKVDNCLECSSSLDLCDKCQRFKALFVEKTANGTSTQCVYRCPSGYRKIFDYARVMRICEKIGTEPTKEVTPEGCEDRSCLQCKNGYYRLLIASAGSSCVKKCPDGYYTGRKDCTLCLEARCAVCSDNPFECEVCKPGYYSVQDSLNGTMRCVTNCPKGFSLVTQNGTASCKKDPEPECTITNCAKCTNFEIHSHHVGCFQCKDGYLLKRNDFKDECVFSCPNGFYKGVKPGTNISACLACGTPFCKSCVSRKKCSECYEPFVIDFKTGNCKLCKTGTVYNRKTKSCDIIQVNSGIKQLPLESIINK